MTVSPEIFSLIQKRSGLNLDNPKDFEILTLLIKEKTGRPLGINTVKRLLGALSEKVNPSQNTLNIIALYLGYDNWCHLAESFNEVQKENDDRNIYPENLPAGTRLILKYAPNRVLELEVTKSKRCLVLATNKGSLLNGDILHIECIRLSKPLESDSLVRNGKPLGPYKSALKGGISHIELISNKKHPSII